MGTLQQTFNTYVKKVTHTFTTQLTIYLLKKLKYKYASQFFRGILFNDWDNYQKRIKTIEVPKWSYVEFLEIHQNHLNSKHIRQFDMIICTKQIAQQNT